MQRNVWATPEIISMSRGLTLVAEEEGREIAFGQLEPDDHLAFLYCSAENARRGIASAIYSALEAHARAKGVSEIRTEASRISRPFFEKKGYTVSEVEQVVRSGVEFERFRMRKKVEPNEQSTEPLPAARFANADSQPGPCFSGGGR